MTDATFVHDELGKLRALVDSLGETLDDYSESRHHGGMKVRGTINSIHIDAYIPHESELGDKLRLKVDALTKHTDPEPIQNWILLNAEAHTITKMAALLDRPESEKGRKDAREVLAMLFPDGAHNMPPVDPAYAISILNDATAGPVDDVPAHVQRIFALLSEIGEINKKRRRDLHTMAKVWVNEAKDQLAARQRPNRVAGFMVPATSADGSPQPRRKSSGPLH